MRMFALMGALVAFGCSCGADSPPPDDAGIGPAADAGEIADAGAPPPSDSGALIDSGAELDAGVEVDAGAPDAGFVDTWSSPISALFDVYCVPCHGAGSATRDYTTYADAFRDRDKIRCGVAPADERPSGCTGFPPPGQFPVGTGPFPTDEQRRQIVAWVEAGAPEGE